MTKQKKPDLRRYFFDTEFNRLDFISIGIVAENGHEFYGISKEFNLRAAMENPWIRVHVINKLDDLSTWKSLDEIRRGILNMIQPAREVEFWAHNNSYDVVHLCELFGGMMAFREILRKEKGIERVTFRDTKEMLRIAVNPKIEPMDEADEHISINDARNERYVFNQCFDAILEQADNPAVIARPEITKP